MASNNNFETPTIASNSSSNTEFYDAESNDGNDTCCVFKSLSEIEIINTTKDGALEEDFSCAKCGRSLKELMAKEKLKQKRKYKIIAI